MLTLRAATIEDAETLADIEAKSFPPAEAASLESFRKRLAVFPDCFLLLMKDDKAVGLIDGMITDYHRSRMLMRFRALQGLGVPRRVPLPSKKKPPRRTGRPGG